MADISKITLPTGNTYDIKDERARELIAAINNWEYVVCTDASNTPYGITWDDEGTTITGTLVATANTMYKIYLVPATDETANIYAEYITVNPATSTYQWEMFGSTALPDMSQYMKNKSGHESGTAGDLAYKNTASGSTTVTVPKTYATTTTIDTTESKSITSTGTTTGSVSITKGAVEIKPKASGTAANKYTPGGSNADSAVSGSCAVTATGSVSTPTISVKTAGATTTVNSITDVGTLPSATMPTYTVANETLTITAGSFSAGTLPTKGADTTVKTSDAAYQSTQPVFTGTEATGTISGTAEGQTFTGEDTYFETASNVATDASFVGDSISVTGSVAVPKTFTSETVTDTTESQSVSITVS